MEVCEPPDTSGKWLSEHFLAERSQLSAGSQKASDLVACSLSPSDSAAPSDPHPTWAPVGAPHRATKGPRVDWLLGMCASPAQSAARPQGSTWGCGPGGRSGFPGGGQGNIIPLCDLPNQPVSFKSVCSAPTVVYTGCSINVLLAHE